MIHNVEYFSQQALADNREVQFVAATPGRPPELACAAMMISATIGEGLRICDRDYLSQFTGILPSMTDQASTGLRTMRSLADHGVSVNVISGVDYEGFADGKPDTTPRMLRTCADDGKLIAERYSAQLLIDKLIDRQAYENPHAAKAYEQRSATTHDIRALLAVNWTVRLDLNGGMLDDYNGEEYEHRPVVVTAIDQSSVTVLDPVRYSSRRREGMVVDFDRLDNAWGSAGYVLMAAGRVQQAGSDIRPLNVAERELNRHATQSGTIAA